MSDRTKYAAALAFALILYFALGNPMDGAGHTLRAFPDGFALIPFPVVLAAYLRRNVKQDGGITLREGLQRSERLIRVPVLAFATFSALYMRVFFDNASLTEIAVFFLMTLLFAWGSGMVFAFICAWIFSRYAPEDTRAETVG